MSEITDQGGESPVKERREELGLTQLQLAYKAGVTPATISNIETGRYKQIRLSPQQFKAICLTLGWTKIEDVPDNWLPPMASQN